MSDDRDPRADALWICEVAALHPLLRELQCVQVTAGQRGHRFGADQHPGVLDDLEHLPDAVVDVAEEVADRGLVRAERQLAGRRCAQSHLVLEVRREDAVALAELAGLEVEAVLRHEEEREALGARAAGAGDAIWPGQHEMDDVLRPVPLARRDEALDALDAPGAVLRQMRTSPAGADVRPGVRLGEHHRGRPPALDHDLRDALLLRRAVAPDGVGEVRAGCGEERRRVRAKEELGDRPLDRRRGRLTTELARQLQTEPFGVHQRPERVPERVRGGDRSRGRVVHRWVPVGLHVRVRELRPGEPVDLGQHAARGVDIHVLVRPGAEHAIAPEDLEQHELEVAQVASVVRPVGLVCHHVPRSSPLLAAMLLVSNYRCYRRVTCDSA